MTSIKSDVFGPQGARVVSVLERTRKLPADEMEQLTDEWGLAYGAAYDTAWEAAWGAAREASRGAAYDAARDAAYDAARDASRPRAWDAIRDAGLACVVSDLVGQHGLKQEHLDVLLKPWITVTGHDPLKGEL